MIGFFALKRKEHLIYTFFIYLYSHRLIHTMKALFRKTLLLSMMFLTLGLTSCDDDDWRLEEEIVGSWCWYYEDKDEYEEIIYNFTPNGKWSYLYIYEDAYGRYKSDVDGGFYSIEYGQLELYSNFYDRHYTYDLDIRGRKMYLWDGEYEYELERTR